MSEPIRRILGKSGIKTSFKPINTLRNIVKSQKDPTHIDNRTGVIYKVQCDTCSDEYIGETGRSFIKRIKEHKDHIRLGRPEKSGIAQHVYDTGHNITFNNASVVTIETDITARKIKESLYIKTDKPVMNRDLGYEVSPLWRSVVPKLTSNRIQNFTHSPTTTP